MVWVDLKRKRMQVLQQGEGFGGEAEICASGNSETGSQTVSRGRASPRPHQFALQRCAPDKYICVLTVVGLTAATQRTWDGRFFSFLLGVSE